MPRMIQSRTQCPALLDLLPLTTHSLVPPAIPYTVKASPFSDNLHSKTFIIPYSPKANHRESSFSLPEAFPRGSFFRFPGKPAESSSLSRENQQKRDCFVLRGKGPKNRSWPFEEEDDRFLLSKLFRVLCPSSVSRICRSFSPKVKALKTLPSKVIEFRKSRAILVVFFGYGYTRSK